ncbi:MULTISPECIES: helix-turn-helix domain-containing protein [unclassified Shinella]|uniref:helix-turn-helix domain-containing protein n=1 Tax=unclassified Shinella TaxID=2643062 RepID=UPI00225DAE74|nr:helix-turn-helix transcriptional regulator [Shinella sp. YE25]MDC7259354.1 helix-turn-helix domain-containing protein [Shinella sp. YE25]CAI0336146.1 HTH cro/C1-type domain-containing protein [Rhizobiaceae bacterium]CAK7261533.1 Helix-turn-helix protein [Shinella sp. WSC3-e]
MKPPIAEQLGAQLRRARKGRDLTQPALAARLGRDRARISELERDLLQARRGRDRLALLLEICDALDLAPVLVPAERLAAVQALLAPAGAGEGAAAPGGTAFDDVFVDLSDGEA